MTEWLDGLTFWEQGAVFVAAAALIGLLDLGITAGQAIRVGAREPMPTLAPLQPLEWDQMDAAIAEFREHLDGLQAFAEAPVGISLREIQEGGGTEPGRSDVTYGLGRGRTEQGEPSPLSGGGSNGTC